MARFLEERIGFTDIPEILAAVLDGAAVDPHPGLDQVLAADAWARQDAAQRIARIEDAKDAEARLMKRTI